MSWFHLYSYKNYGSGPTKYPLTDMLQFVLEFASTKPTNISPAEDLRPAASSPTPAAHPLSDPLSKDRWVLLGVTSPAQPTQDWLIKTSRGI